MKYIYLGQPDYNGLSPYLNLDINSNNIFKTVSSSLVSEINTLLPEREKFHHTKPHWLKKNDILLLEKSTVSLTFVTEGAGYKNALGYYFYNKDKTIKSLDEIDTLYIVLPNASKDKSGGKLKTGDTMQLYSQFTTQEKDGLTIGTPTKQEFDADTVIGFVIIANGWKSGKVSAYSPKYSTNNELNPEKALELTYHSAMLKLSETDKLVLAFEDLPREKSWCDHDFNDLVTIINTDISKMDDDVFEDPNEDTTGEPEKYDVGYKKCFAEVIENSETKVTECVVELYIPHDSIIVTKEKEGKSRTNRVYVKKIKGVKNTTKQTNLSKKNYTGSKFNKCHSYYNSSFVYEVGKYVSTELDKNEFQICDEGIHFFFSKRAAELYDFTF